MSRPRENLATGIFLVVLALMGIFVALRFEVTTDITAFLPTGEDQELAQISRRVADSELSRTMVLTLGLADTGGAEESLLEPDLQAVDRLVEASQAIEASLLSGTHKDAFAYVEGGPKPGLDRAVYSLYHPRRFGLLAQTEVEAAARATQESFAVDAARLKEQLSKPMSPVLSRLAPSDPMLVLPTLFKRLEGARAGEVSLYKNRFITSDKRFAVLLLGTHASAFDSTAQRPVLEAIDDAFQEANSVGDLELEMSGLNRFAIRSEDVIKADIQRVSLLSVLGLAILLIVVFRSVRLVGLASIPIGAGVLAGCAATLLVYGRLHGVTLAFGASLIGVSIDYVVHFYAHHVVGGQRSDRSIREVGPAVITGAATTCIGFLALATAAFPGLQEVALFAISGIVSALLATLLVVPRLTPDRDPTTEAKSAGWAERASKKLGSVLQSMRSRGAWLALLPALAILVMVAGLPSVAWNDSLNDFSRLDAELLAEDERVRGRISRYEQTQFVVASGATEDDALMANDQVHRAMIDAIDAGEIAAFRSIADLLPSQTQQRNVAHAFVHADGLEENLRSAFRAEGIRPNALGPFFESLAAARLAYPNRDEFIPSSKAADPASSASGSGNGGDSPDADANKAQKDAGTDGPNEREISGPITFADLAESPLGGMVRSFRLELGDDVAFVTFLNGVEDREQLEARIDGIEGAVLIDQADLMGAATQAYQRETMEKILLGLIAVFALLLLRYRHVKKALAAFVPSVLAAGTTVSVLGMLGLGLDLVSLTALLMVVSIGVDYGVFLVDAESLGEEQLNAALLSITLACLSTLLGFGLLALSDYPMLFTIGVTAGTGVLSSLILAPTTLILFRFAPAPGVNS